MTNFLCQQIIDIHMNSLKLPTLVVYRYTNLSYVSFGQKNEPSFCLKYKLISVFMAVLKFKKRPE